MAGTHDGNSTFGLQDFFTTLVRSFTPAAYPQLAARPASSSALYLAGLALLVTLLLTPLLYTHHERALAETRAYFERILPEALYFEDGTAHYDGEQPVVQVEEEGKWRYVVIIDTTGQTTKVPDEYEQGMLITDTGIVHKVRRRDGTTDTVNDPIPETTGRVAARQFYLDAIERTKWQNFAMGVGHLYLAAVLPLFILAGLGAALSIAMEATRPRRETRLSFATCFGAAACAATPVAFITASTLVVQTALQFYVVVGVPLLLFLLLITSGMRACRRAFEAGAGAHGARSQTRRQT